MDTFKDTLWLNCFSILTITSSIFSLLSRGFIVLIKKMKSLLNLSHNILALRFVMKYRMLNKSFQTAPPFLIIISLRNNQITKFNKS